MSQRNLLSGSVVFAVVLGIILVGAAVAPYAAQLGGGGSADVQNVAKQQFNADELVVTPSPESGTIKMESNAESKTVLIDVAHENDVSESDIQPLVDTLVANGHKVKYLTREDLRNNFNGSLRQADAYVAINPGRPYSSKHLTSLQKFEEGGGRIALIGDPQSGGAVSLLGLFSFGSRSTPGGDAGLTSDYGVTFGSTSLYNMHDYYLNHKNIYASPDESTSLTKGVDEVVLHDAAPLSVSAGSAKTALVTGGETCAESTREPGPYTVAVQSDSVVAIGDADFLSSESAYEADNEVLIGNLADFLVSGDKASGVPEPVSDGSSSSVPVPA